MNQTHTQTRTTEGRSHDLLEILDLCLAHPPLARAWQVKIFWFGRRNPHYTRRRPFALAWYHPGSQSVRVSRMLDQDIVPEYVLCDIVGHELLHHLLEWEQDPHNLAFRQAEANLPWHRMSEAWLTANLGKLIAKRAT